MNLLCLVFQFSDVFKSLNLTFLLSAFTGVNLKISFVENEIGGTKAHTVCSAPSCDSFVR